MNMEIKFRGKRIDTGEWVYGGFMIHENVKLCIASKEEVEKNKKYLIMIDGFADWNLSPPINGFEVIPETVGWFTNLHDKNGKEIFGGDIIRWPIGYENFSTLTMYVGYNELGMRLYKKLPCGCCGKSKAGTIPSFGIFKKCEIIGNLFDNPELLNQQT